MKNPKWQRDEVILALNLYFELNYKNISASNAKVIELSNLLNRLPINQEKKSQDNFRNPNGVSLKLSNFLAIDPDNDIKGMKAYSKLDKEIFYEFYQDRETLSSIAKQIRLITNDKSISKEILYMPLEDGKEEYKEGIISYKFHLYRERNRTLVQKKKNSILERDAKLVCEVCGFDFEEQYGNLGRNFIECHHKVPLSKQSDGRKTKLEDLALVCSNCHKMLHKANEVLSIDELKEIIARQHSPLSS